MFLSQWQLSEDFSEKNPSLKKNAIITLKRKLSFVHIQNKQTKNPIASVSVLTAEFHPLRQEGWTRHPLLMILKAGDCHGTCLWIHR